MNFRSAFFIALIFFCQVIFSLAYSPSTNTYDAFPLHRWALFSKIHKVGEYPIMYIHSHNGETINPPANFFDFFRDYKNLHFLTGRDYMESWVKLKESGDDDKAEDMLARLESHFFSRFSTVQYEIRIEEVDRLEYLHARKIRKTVKSYGMTGYSQGNRP